MTRKRIRRKIDEELVLQLYENGYNIARLAKHFKVSRSVIVRIFEDNSIRYKRPVSKEFRATISRDALYEMFVLRHMHKIAKFIELDHIADGFHFKIRMFIGLHAIDALNYKPNEPVELIWDRVKRYYLTHRDRLEKSETLNVVPSAPGA